MTSGILACVTGCEINPFSEVRCKHLFSNCNSFAQGLPFWGESKVVAHKAAKQSCRAIHRSYRGRRRLSSGVSWVEVP